MIFTDNQKQKYIAKIVRRAGKATGKNKMCYNIEYRMPNELAGKQTWINTNMCDNLKIVEDGSY